MLSGFTPACAHRMSSVLRERQRAKFMILTLALRSRARGRPMPNVFSRGRARRRLEALGSPRAGLDGVAVLRGREGGSASLQGLADGPGLGVDQLTFGVRPRCQAGDLVNGGGRFRGCGGRMELLGE